MQQNQCEPLLGKIENAKGILEMGCFEVGFEGGGIALVLREFQA